MFFKEINNIFGIIDFKKLKESDIPTEVLTLVNQRETARKNADWVKSDELRQEIEKYGYVVQDLTNGPQLKKI